MDETERDADLIEIDIPENDGADAQKPDAIDDLKAQLDAMRQRADVDAERARKAEADAARARLDADQVRRVVADTQVDAIGNAIAAEEAAAAGAERDYESAMAEGDYTKAAKAQRAMAKAEARLATLEASKADAETRKAAPDRQENGDPVEDYINRFPTERTREWLREHRDCVTDPERNNLMIAAHHRAVRENLKPDTDAYFRFIEGRLKLAADDGDSGGEASEQPTGRAEPAAAPARRSAPYTAPPSRSAPSANGRTSATRVTLTAAEIEMARAMDMTPAEYAKHKLDLKRSGEIA